MTQRRIIFHKEAKQTDFSEFDELEWNLKDFYISRDFLRFRSKTSVRSEAIVFR